MSFFLSRNMLEKKKIYIHAFGRMKIAKLQRVTMPLKRMYHHFWFVFFLSPKQSTSMISHFCKELTVNEAQYFVLVEGHDLTTQHSRNHIS